MTLDIQAVVFDMGGVLVELGPLTEILGPDPTMDDDTFWSKWLASPSVRDFEMGRCSPAEFGDRLVAELGIDGGGDALLARFAAWPKGLLPGAGALVSSLGAHDVEVAVLSNTNALHWETQPDAADVQALFDRRYLSYELGLAKPDATIFQHVVDDLGFEPDSILFLDDNQINVDGARAVGMRAELAKGVDAARDALVGVGLA